MGIPAELRHTAVEEVQMLLPGQEVRLPMEIVLTGSAGKALRLDVRTDKGTYAGTLAMEGWELLTPAFMTAGDFDATRRRLRGLGETAKTLPLASLGLRGGVSAEEELIARVRRLLNVHTVQGAGCGELMFAGVKREMTKEEKVLVTLVTTRFVSPLFSLFLSQTSLDLSLLSSPHPSFSPLHPD